MTKSPEIEQFLERHPALRGSVADVLARAADVREARARALPPAEDPPPRHGGELDAAVEALEDLAAGGAVASEDVRTAVRRLLVAATGLRAASHSMGPRRRTTSPADREILFRALRRFRDAYAALEERARDAAVERLPWRIELATHVDPATPVAAMEITGYDLPRTPAASLAWGERCFLSGARWNTDRHASPRIRYRSLDSCSHTLALRFYALWRRLRAALDVLGESSPEAVEQVVRLFPSLEEGYVAETASPTFQKLGLFDYPSLAVSLNNLFRAFAERPLFGRRTSSGYVWESYGDVRERALCLAYGLERLGLRPGARLGLAATSSRAELYLADFAAIFGGLVTVGLPDAGLPAVARRARLDAVVAERAVLGRVLDACPGLGLAVAFGEGDPVRGPVVELTELSGAEAPASWTSGSGVAPSTGVVYGDAGGWRTARSEGLRPDADSDLYTILFTSGSTGTPKGTVVTRRRWAEEMCFDADVWPYVGVSFQPPSTAADRGSVWRALANGGRVGFARRGAALFADVRAIRPTVFDAPPVVWNTIYSEYRRAIRDPALSRREAAAVRKRFRGYLGGRLAFLAVGGAPSDPEVRRTMTAIFGVPLREGYGTTETGNIAADGVLLPGLDYRLVDVPEMGFHAADEPRPRGELAVRTPRTTARYLDDEDATKEGFTDDGYFLTGDVVEIGPERQCEILGRRKGFFKLAGSEFVSPEALEKVYSRCELVAAILVTGAPLRVAVVAVAVPSRDGVTRGEILRDLRGIARREGLRLAEVPAGVVLAPRAGGRMPWTSENGLLTASLKLDRTALEEKYRAEIEAVYTRAEEARAEDDEEVGGDDLASVEERLRRLAAVFLSLRPEDVDGERSFLEQGGDSLGSMELLLRLEEVFPGAWRGDPRGLVELSLAEVARRMTSLSGGGRRPLTLALSPEGRREQKRQLLAGERGPEKSFALPNPEPKAPPAPSPPARDLAKPETADGRTRTGRGWGEGATPPDPNADAAALALPDPLPPPTASDDVFLTGATGFLGIHLLAHLAASLPPSTKIYALVRAADDGEARERLRRRLVAAALDAAAADRVVALAGSLTAERLGLADGAYRRLASEVGLVYHAAAEVSAKGYADLRDTNVLGTRRVLELAAKTTVKAVCFVSSLNVAFFLRRPAWEGSPLPERLSPRAISRNPGYAVSKWVSERMLQRLFVHCGGALRASVSRPALLAWSRATGVANEDDLLTRALVSCLELRCAVGPDDVGVPGWVPETPVSTRGLDLVPVDFAARAVERLGELTRRGSLPAPARQDQVPTFHVSNLAPGEAGHVTLARLMDLLVAADLRCGGDPAMSYLPFADWAVLAEIASSPVVPVLGQLREAPPFYERTKAERFAAALDGEVSCPPIDRAALEVFVRRHACATVPSDARSRCLSR